jgi:putative transposase
MLNGIKFKSIPTLSQKEIFSQWMGCSRFIWNAKCKEDSYLRKFAKKYLPVGTFPKPDQKYSQYKNTELTPFLSLCPSQILRNSVSNWYSTYKNFLKGLCGRPKIKKKDGRGSILLTRELFKFEVDEKNKKIKLFIGTKKYKVGYLDVKWHDKKWLKYGYPNSIVIKRTGFGRYSVSFCYDNQENPAFETKPWFDYLKTLPKEDLERRIMGVDRGVNVICATSDNQRLNPDLHEKKSLLKNEKRKKRYQRRMARQQKNSKRKKKHQKKLSKIHEKKKNIRNNICHRISKKLVTNVGKDVIIFENLKTKNMTKSASGNLKKPGKNVKQKSGLNREILDKSWNKIEIFTVYKAKKSNKIVFKIDPKYTSQECASCDRIHPENRKGNKFKCICGHEDHADNNAGKVMKKRAVKLFLHSGTELSEGYLLKNRLLSDIVRGAEVRPVSRNSKPAVAMKRKKRRSA